MAATAAVTVAVDSGFEVVDGGSEGCKWRRQRRSSRVVAKAAGNNRASLGRQQ